MCLGRRPSSARFRTSSVKCPVCSRPFGLRRSCWGRWETDQRRPSSDEVSSPALLHSQNNKTRTSVAYWSFLQHNNNLRISFIAGCVHTYQEFVSWPASQKDSRIKIGTNKFTMHRYIMCNLNKVCVLNKCISSAVKWLIAFKIKVCFIIYMCVCVCCLCLYKDTHTIFTGLYLYSVK